MGTSQLQPTDADQSPTYLIQYKITSENGQRSYTHMRTLADRFRNATVAGFKDRALYISTIAHCGSLSRQRKATKRSENTTSSRALKSLADHRLPRLPEVYRMRIPSYCGPAAVVLYISVILVIVVLLLPSCYWKNHQNETEFKCYFSLLRSFSKTFKRKPPRRGQPQHGRLL